MLYPRDSWLRKAWPWLLLPVVAYLVAVPFLGGGAVFLPVVIMNAPLGVIGCFEKISLQPTPQQQGVMTVLHGVFWIMLLSCVTFRQKLPAWLLNCVWALLAVLLIMSVGGCAAQLGPGLRSDGNWH